MMTKRRPLDVRDRLDAARLCLVLGPGTGAGRDPVDVARAAVRGGADMVQVRFKQAACAERADLVLRLREACAAWRPLIIVNDDLAAALESGADGVHLGQEDLPVPEARRAGGSALLIGLSTHDVSQARAAAGLGADYIGCGAMFPTATKEQAIVIGPALLPRAARAARLPCFAIGGITLENVSILVARGCRRLAAGRAIQEAADPEAAARAFRRALAGE
ncbi:MAG: thiamine phosphate synthase [Planctomycetes bacterium]|nr:thiamine phosphate synthase [Planctomycetota bacterium]